MRRFSVRPAITLKGRKFKGLRGWAGKPAHPPLTDFPVAAYVLAAAFDVISVIGGDGNEWGHDFWRAATYTMIGGAIVSVFTALTGFFDWWRSSEPGNQARRTANTHAVIMLSVTVLVIAALVSWGATYGGSLVYDYGFNVEIAGDSPVWHQSETDVFPGEKDVA